MAGPWSSLRMGGLGVEPVMVPNRATMSLVSAPRDRMAGFLVSPSSW